MRASREFTASRWLTCATSNHTVNDGVSTDHLVNRSIDTREPD